MNIVYIDCAAGVSGRALLGALIDLIENKNEIVEEINRLTKKDFELKFEKRLIKSVSATGVSLKIPNDDRCVPVCEFTEQIVASAPAGNRAARGLHEISSRYIAARARLSGIKPEGVSAGKSALLYSATISIGIFTALEKLTADEIITTPISIQGAAGMRQKPFDPMLLELAKGTAVKTGDEHNTITALGIALVGTCANKTGAIPEMVVCGTGHGVLSADSESESLLSAVYGRKGIGEIETCNKGEIIVIETNIDDMNPEILSYATGKILASGALDTFLTPIIMKKGRPANLLTVLCDEQYLDRITKTIFKETTTLGIRIRKEGRKKLERKIFNVSTPYGEISVKAGYWAQERNPIQLSPEFEQCREIAQKTGVPLKDIYWAVRKAALEAKRTEN